MKAYKKINKLIFDFLTKILSDTLYSKIRYRIKTGKKLNLKNPKGFNEKLWWLKLYNRDPLLTICTDKNKVRDYVKSKGLENILIPQIGVYNSPDQIDFETLPDNAYIKTNHSTNTNFVYKKNSFNKKKFNKLYSKHLKTNHYKHSREWNYKNIDPKIIIEENINSDNEVKLADFRFFCFDGKVEFLQVDIDTASDDGSHYIGAKRNIYDRNFKLLDVKTVRPSFDPKVLQKPVNFEEMVSCAEILSNPFVFSRIDLYNIDGKIKFGEITPYPSGATQLFYPEYFELEMGSKIDLESKKIIRK